MSTTHKQHSINNTSITSRLWGPRSNFWNEKEREAFANNRLPQSLFQMKIITTSIPLPSHVEETRRATDSADDIFRRLVHPGAVRDARGCPNTHLHAPGARSKRPLSDPEGDGFHWVLVYCYVASVL
ncbi:hypothetical protein TNIN_158861 [Trichonephila inaurata madagascariensis]|uniref:Uncharacterized protein n=1 Tax=Trichonephila inaurata madagascariensis TaxID=2747483 RepID=A0A8X6JB97_9ARAC|nr:hypothetical protein TNIN_158861 [Trichonephila inaurata madagascariensis]